MEPLLVSQMRRRLEKGCGDDEVRIWSVTRGLVGGTSIRGFLEEYDEAIAHERDEAYKDAQGFI